MSTGQITREAAIGRVQAWLRQHADGDLTTGESAMRVRAEFVTRDELGWAVPYNAAAFLDRTDLSQGLFPTPVLLVPDDGGEIRPLAAAMVVPEPSPSPNAPSPDDPTNAPFVQWEPLIDPEFDPAEWPRMAVPLRAIVRWVAKDLEFRPTGPIRENDRYVRGGARAGWPLASTRAEKLLQFRIGRWIDDAEFARQLLDCEILVGLDQDSRPRVENQRLVAFTSERWALQGAARWRRMTGRQALEGFENTGISLNPGYLIKHPVSAADLTAALESSTPRTGVPEPVDVLNPRYDPELRSGRGEAVRALDKLSERAAVYQYGLTRAECESLLDAYSVLYKLKPRPDQLSDAGLIPHYRTDGTVEPAVWHFGKFHPDYELSHHRGSQYAWPRLIGAFVGFAIGDSIGTSFDEHGSWDGETLEAGGLTRQLLFQTEAVIRALPEDKFGDEVPSSLPRVGRPDGWLNAVTAGTKPAPSEFSTLLAAALPASLPGATPYNQGELPYLKGIAHELIGAAAGPDLAEAVDVLTTVFRFLLRAGWDSPLPIELPPPFWMMLDDLEKSLPDGDTFHDALALLRPLVELQGTEDSELLKKTGNGRVPYSVVVRALAIAVKHGHQPERAILAAADHSGSSAITAALVGAMVGAHHGVPNLPAKWVARLPQLGLIDNIATDAFSNFHRHGVFGDGPTALEKWQKRYPGE